MLFSHLLIKLGREIKKKKNDLKYSVNYLNQINIDKTHSTEKTIFKSTCNSHQN